jgi:hypothetical protein
VFQLSPKLNPELTKEENFAFHRGLKINNVEKLNELKIVWQDIYGLGVRIEKLLLINCSKEILLVYGYLLYIFRENRGRYTNNHLLMNILILLRLKEHLNEIFNIQFNNDELKFSIDSCWDGEHFLEESSYYLFLLGWRFSQLNKNPFITDLRVCNSILFYNSLLRLHNSISWIGDISPDPINIEYGDRDFNENVKLKAFNFGFMIYVQSQYFKFKISTSNISKRHGHEDFGQVVLHSENLKILDKGIDDLSNNYLKTSHVHSNWRFGNFIKVIQKKTKLELHFENAIIALNDREILIEYIFEVIPDVMIISNHSTNSSSNSIVYFKNSSKAYNTISIREFLISDNTIKLCVV